MIAHSTETRNFTTESFAEIQTRLLDKETFVLNIITAWCPDCYKHQAPNMPSFALSLASQNINVVNFKVQDTKHVYLSSEIESFVETLGGHGFPRTVLIVKGCVVDKGNVEVTQKDDLLKLSQRFISLC